MKKRDLVLLLLASSFALVFAYILQFVFDYQPCILCLYQRLPFFIIIVLSACGLILFSSERLVKIAVVFCIILLAVNVAISFYHFGVEEKIFTGPTNCEDVSNLNKATSLEELKLVIGKAKAVPCDEPQLKFLKLSLATWNFIYCVVVLGLLYWIYKRRARTDRLGAVGKK
ncbi:MAG: disulfide bond formation protein B [Alphaproteobacteria bacterium]|nr:disulfide bond formation protein B [Alphaproteobacteria bacterium]